MNYQRAFNALKVPILLQRVAAPGVGCSEIVNRGTANLRRHDLYITRYKSTAGIVVSKQPNPGFFKKMFERMGWFDHSKTKLKVSGFLLYESVADRVQYTRFFEEFNLPDTFFSWFLVTELHVWMLLVRAMNEGEEGRFVRNCVVEAMWQDVTTRTKKLGAANPSSVREQVRDLSEQFQAALIGYDEGLLTDDRVLAGAVWRRFFLRSCDQPEDVEKLVSYIRKQVSLLDQLSTVEILVKPDITWIDLQSSKPFT